VSNQKVNIDLPAGYQIHRLLNAMPLPAYLSHLNLFSPEIVDIETDAILPRSPDQNNGPAWPEHLNRLVYRILLAATEMVKAGGL